MKILMASSEYAPYAETGKLADDVSDLCISMAESGHEVVVVLPLYRCVREQKSLTLKRSKVRFAVPLGSSRLNCVVWEAVDPKGIRLLFIERDEYFDRTGLYGMDGRDYEDNAARFIFFKMRRRSCSPRIARCNPCAWVATCSGARLRARPKSRHRDGAFPAGFTVSGEFLEPRFCSYESPSGLLLGIRAGVLWQHEFSQVGDRLCRCGGASRQSLRFSDANPRAWMWLGKRLARTCQ